MLPQEVKRRASNHPLSHLFGRLMTLVLYQWCECDELRYHFLFHCSEQKRRCRRWMPLGLAQG